VQELRRAKPLAVLPQSTFLTLTTLRLLSLTRLPRSCSLSFLYFYHLVVTCVTRATTGLFCFAGLISLDAWKFRRPSAELLRLKLRRGLSCLRLIHTTSVFFRIVIHMFYLCSNALTAHEQDLTLPGGFSTAPELSPCEPEPLPRSYFSTRSHPTA
jgi:hypothetical protein